MSVVHQNMPSYMFCRAISSFMEILYKVLFGGAYFAKLQLRDTLDYPCACHIQLHFTSKTSYSHDNLSF